MIEAWTTVDLIVEIWYKLHCLSFFVEITSELIDDNLSVVVNTMIPSSNIKKKHLSCQIMRVWEAIAAGFVQLRQISSILNVSNILTKLLPPLPFHHLEHQFLFWHTSSNTNTNIDDKS